MIAADVSTSSTARSTVFTVAPILFVLDKFANLCSARRSRRCTRWV